MRANPSVVDYKPGRFSAVHEQLHRVVGASDLKLQCFSRFHPAKLFGISICHCGVQ
jgi:hypothetical protein